MEFVKTLGSSAFIGDMNNFQAQAIELLSTANDGVSYQNAIKQIKFIATNKFLERYDLGVKEGISSEQEFKDWITTYKTSFETVLRDLDQYKQGGDAAKYIENQVKLVQGRQELALSRQFDVPSLEMIGKLGPVWTTLMGNYLTNNPEAAVAVQGAGASLLQQGINPNVMASVKPNGGFAQVIAPSVVAGQTPEAQKAAAPVLDTGARAIMDIPDINERNKAFEDAFNNFLKQDNINLDANGQAAYNRFLGQYLNGPTGVPSMMDALKRADGKVKLDINPAGGIVFSGEGAEQFTAVYGNRMNLSLKAYAKAYGMQPGQVLEGFVNEFGIIPSDKQFELPAATATKEDVGKLLKEGKITKAEHDWILADMAATAPKTQGAAGGNAPVAMEAAQQKVVPLETRNKQVINNARAELAVINERLSNPAALLTQGKGDRKALEERRTVLQQLIATVSGGGTTVPSFESKLAEQRQILSQMEPVPQTIAELQQTRFSSEKAAERAQKEAEFARGTTKEQEPGKGTVTVAPQSLGLSEAKPKAEPVAPKKEPRRETPAASAVRNAVNDLTGAKREPKGTLPYKQPVNLEAAVKRLEAIDARLKQLPQGNVGKVSDRQERTTLREERKSLELFIKAEKEGKPTDIKPVTRAAPSGKAPTKPATTSKDKGLDTNLEQRTAEAKSIAYEVKAGDTLSAIANKAGVDIRDILRVNPKITDPGKIRAGITIMIPEKKPARKGKK
jgi:LysM repeat protein